MAFKRKEIDLEVLDDKQLDLLAENFAISEKEWPSLFMRPNVAEYRAFEEMYTLEKDGSIAEMTSIEFANGVGKTSMLILDIVGCMVGPDYLAQAFYPKCAIDFWNSLAELRDKGHLPVRLLCSAIDMKEQGSVLDLLKRMFPWAVPTKQDNTGCYKQIDIPHPSNPAIVNHVAVLTFDQEPKKHEGPTLKRIFCNENLPEELWTATSSRIRGGGSIAQFATILDKSTHLDELEDGIYFRLKRCRGHIYENCIGEEVTDEMAEEVYSDIGVELEKNLDGPGYITYGVLHRAAIEATIESYQKTNPDEVPARKSGKPLSEGGKIYANFNREYNVVEDDSFARVPEDWPMVQIIDPHPARPDAVIWGLVCSNDRLVIVDEWPSYEEFGYFDKIKDCRYTIGMKTDVWREIESSRGYQDRVGDNRVGDPNQFRNPDEETEKNIADLYAEHGFEIDIDVNDDFEYGKEMVNESFWFDKNVRKHNPSDPAGKSRLVIYKRCINTIRACENFRRKILRDKTAPISEQVDKRYSCFASAIRYFVVWHQTHHFADIRVDLDKVSDYSLINRGRDPMRLRTNESDKRKTIKGRRVVDMVGVR